MRCYAGRAVSIIRFNTINYVAGLKIITAFNTEDPAIYRDIYTFTTCHFVKLEIVS